MTSPLHTFLSNLFEHDANVSVSMVTDNAAGSRIAPSCVLAAIDASERRWESSPVSGTKGEKRRKDTSPTPPRRVSLRRENLGSPIDFEKMNIVADGTESFQPIRQKNKTSFLTRSKPVMLWDLDEDEQCTDQIIDKAINQEKAVAA